jgi:DNA topoisomerase-1
MPQKHESDAPESGGQAATAVKERTCPECQGKLVQRKSKFGPFLGCANYPKCRHIARS